MATDNDLIELNAIFSLIWAKKLWIILGTFIGAVFAIMLAFSAKQLYQSDTVLVPVSDYGAQMGGASLSSMGGLASLAGIDLGSKDAATIKRIEYLSSRRFLIPFIETQQLKPFIFSERWDAERKSWLPHAWYKRLWATIRGRELADIPSDLDAYAVFLDDHMRVEEDKLSGFINLSVWLQDAEKAQTVTNAIIEQVNTQIREQEREKITARITFLQSEAENARMNEVKVALFSLIESEYKQFMLVNVAAEYAFEVLDYPQLPERLSRPSKVLYTISGLFLGFFMSMVIVLLFGRPKQNN